MKYFLFLFFYFLTFPFYFCGFKRLLSIIYIFVYFFPQIVAVNLKVFNFFRCIEKKKKKKRKTKTKKRRHLNYHKVKVYKKIYMRTYSTSMHISTYILMHIYMYVSYCVGWINRNLGNLKIFLKKKKILSVSKVNLTRWLCSLSGWQTTNYLILIHIKKFTVHIFFGKFSENCRGSQSVK